jgi:hypothetical protein
MESKIELTDRLRNERRWKEACEFCEQERQRLRAEGLSKADANERSWQAMAERFPPLPSIMEIIVPTDEVPPLPQRERYAPYRYPNFEDDICWVYEHLDRLKTEPD